MSVEYRSENSPSGARRRTATAICASVSNNAAANGLNGDSERVITSPSGTAEQIRKAGALQELVDPPAIAPSSFIFPVNAGFSGRGLTTGSGLYSRDIARLDN